MDTTLHDYGSQIFRLLLMTGLCGIRLSIVFLVFPPMAGDFLQGFVRNGVVVLWSFLIAAGQPADLPALHGIFLIAVCLKEAVIGLAIGYAASSAFWVAQSVGSYMDELTGYNNVQLSNPSYGEQTSIVGTLLGQCAIAAFWVLGGMSVLLGMVYGSYEYWPLAALSPNPGALLESFVLHQTDSMMLMLAKLAMPFMLLLVIIDLGIGMAARVAAKLDLQTLGQPLKGAFVLLALALLVATFVDQVKDQLTLRTLASQMQSLGQRGVQGRGR